VDDPRPFRPLLITDETIAFRRWLERFGKASQKAGHLHHRGKVRTVDADKGRAIELDCECGVTLGPWQDR
jgi:hypothetical protein